MHFSAPKRKKTYLAPKCSLGPPGLSDYAPIPEKTQQSEGRFFRFLWWIHLWWKLNIYHFDCRNLILQIVFVQKSIIPPLRTKPYYSKPKWRSRRLKSLKLQKKCKFPPFCAKVAFLLQKCILGSFVHFWANFALWAPDRPKQHQETITPTSFWAIGPKNAFWAPKCEKY